MNLKKNAIASSSKTSTIKIRILLPSEVDHNYTVCLQVKVLSYMNHVHVCKESVALFHVSLEVGFEFTSMVPLIFCLEPKRH